MKHRLDRRLGDDRLAALLATSGADYELVEKKRHLLLLVGGKAVGVIPHGRNSGGCRQAENMLAAVRRRLREMGLGAR